MCRTAYRTCQCATVAAPALPNLGGVETAPLLRHTVMAYTSSSVRGEGAMRAYFLILAISLFVLVDALHLGAHAQGTQETPTSKTDVADVADQLLAQVQGWFVNLG